MDDVAVRVGRVSKNFRLPHEKVSSVKNLFVHAVRYLRNHRTYEVQHALKDVSFEVKQGEFFGIVGRNGSGKSTLLKMLAGIYQPSKGKIQVNGKLVPFIELGVGFSPELTGRENVYLNGALLGFSKKEIEAQYKDIVDFAELEPFMDQKLKNYSSGMQVRLAFSMAVRAKADVLLIDEVLAVGDADFQRKCFNYFNNLKKEKTTVIFVSHNMDAVREYCDRAMLIENSEVVEIGSTDEVAEKYLQLFMEDKTDDGIGGEEENRWGDQAIKVIDIKVEVTKETIIIKETIKATQAIEHPIAGFRIRDAAGSDITGTNTLIENKTLQNFEKGQTAVLVWQMYNCLRDGKYSVDPALLHPDKITVADWWNDAVRFTVKKKRHIPYTIDPGFDLTVKVEQ